MLCFIVSGNVSKKNWPRLIRRDDEILRACNALMTMTVGPFIGEIASLHDAQTAAALDNKQNMEQREQYYATVRKPLRSPIHEMATLEKIPGNWRGETLV